MPNNVCSLNISLAFWIKDQPGQSEKNPHLSLFISKSICNCQYLFSSQENQPLHKDRKLCPPTGHPHIRKSAQDQAVGLSPQATVFSLLVCSFVRSAPANRSEKSRTQKITASRYPKNWNILTKTKDQLYLQELGFTLTFKTMGFFFQLNADGHSLNFEIYLSKQMKKTNLLSFKLPYSTVNSVGRTKMHTILKE